MKIAANIAGGLLGLAFVAFSLMFFFGMMPEPDFPEGSYIDLFMRSMGPSGYMGFVKACELIGGILVAVPKTRNWGLLVLGPVLVNIIAFHIFIGKGEHLLDPVLIFLCLLAAFLLWVGRKAFGGLLN